MSGHRGAAQKICVLLTMQHAGSATMPMVMSAALLCMTCQVTVQCTLTRRAVDTCGLAALLQASSSCKLQLLQDKTRLTPVLASQAKLLLVMRCLVKPKWEIMPKATGIWSCHVTNLCNPCAWFATASDQPACAQGIQACRGSEEGPHSRAWR